MSIQDSRIIGEQAMVFSKEGVGRISLNLLVLNKKEQKHLTILDKVNARYAREQ
jgi:hypothetical protein